MNKRRRFKAKARRAQRRSRRQVGVDLGFGESISKFCIRYFGDGRRERFLPIDHWQLQALERVMASRDRFVGFGRGAGKTARLERFIERWRAEGRSVLRYPAGGIPGLELKGT